MTEHLYHLYEEKPTGDDPWLPTPDWKTLRPAESDTDIFTEQTGYNDANVTVSRPPVALPFSFAKGCVVYSNMLMILSMMPKRIRSSGSFSSNVPKASV